MGVLIERYYMKKTLKIEKGNWYECTNKFRYGKTMFFKGVKYIAQENNALYDTLGNKLWFEGKFLEDGYKVEEFFKLYKEGCSFYLIPKTNSLGVSKTEGNTSVTESYTTKFKVGDWIILHNEDLFHIISNAAFFYIVENVNGDKFTFTHTQVDENAILWTIDDAKNGDILCDNRINLTIIFRRIGNSRWDDVVDYHFLIFGNRSWKKQSNVSHCGHKDDTEFVPATKEQRQELFNRLENAGYEWDNENKSLKELPNKEQWIPQEGDIIRKKGTYKPLYRICGQCEQKPWEYTIVQINDEMLAGGNVTYYALMTYYELVVKASSEKFNSDNIQPLTKKEVEKLREEIDLKPLRTEFGKQFEAYMYHPETDERIMTACCKKLLELAKKEIVDDINQFTVDNLVHDFKNGYKGNFNDKSVSDIYRQGIIDIIEKICQ